VAEEEEEEEEAVVSPAPTFQNPHSGPEYCWPFGYYANIHAGVPPKKPPKLYSLLVAPTIAPFNQDLVQQLQGHGQLVAHKAARLNMPYLLVW
jgi:hypothetical protein